MPVADGVDIVAGGTGEIIGDGSVSDIYGRIVDHKDANKLVRDSQTPQALVPQALAIVSASIKLAAFAFSMH